MGCTAFELASSRAQFFSLSPQGTSGKRAGETGIIMVTSNANRMQDHPPLPSPLLPRREEKEKTPGFSFTSSGIVEANGAIGCPCGLKSALLRASANAGLIANRQTCAASGLGVAFAGSGF